MKYNIYAIFLSLFFSIICGCKDEVDVNGDFEVEIFENTQLKEALTKKGYSFDENGQLICNKMVLDTKELDLSNCNLVSLEGLNLFTALESLNVDDNEFFETFNFEHLPKSLKSISLKGNDNITYYKSLMDETNSKVVRNKLELLRLPASAKWNTNEIPAFARNAAEVTKVELFDESGNFSEYTFLREIPDAKLQSHLKNLYPSVFDKASGKINLNFVMTESADLVINEEIENLEGVEYIIGRNDFKGNVSLKGVSNKKYNMDYVALSSGVKSFNIVNINTPNGIYLSNASSLKSVRVENNDEVPYLKLSGSFLSGKMEDINTLKNGLTVINCKVLSGIVIGNETTGVTGKIILKDLPSLQELDLSVLNGIHTFVAKGLSNGIEKLKLPLEINTVSDGYGNNKGVSNICLSVENESQFQSFIDLCRLAAKVYDVSFFY